MKPLVVLLPGIDGTGWLLDPYVKELKKLGYDCERWTYDSQDTSHYDALTSTIVDQLPDQPFVLVGESFGGPLAAKIAASKPKYLLGLGQIVTFMHKPLPGSNVLQHVLDLIPGDVVPGKFLEWWFTAFANDEHIRKTFRRILDHVPLSTLQERALHTLNVDTRSHIQSLNIPIFALHATYDTVILNPCSKDFSKNNNLAKDSYLEGGHLLLASRPKDCAQWLDVSIQQCLAYEQKWDTNP